VTTGLYRCGLCLALHVASSVSDTIRPVTCGILVTRAGFCL
jgi:hypothetical protein